MMADSVDKLRAGVRDVSDFPKKGIVFKDITPILSDHALFRASIDLFLDRCRGKKIDKIVGIDARGFLFGSTVAKPKWKCMSTRWNPASAWFWSTICLPRAELPPPPPRSSKKSAANCW